LAVRPPAGRKVRIAFSRPCPNEAGRHGTPATGRATVPCRGRRPGGRTSVLAAMGGKPRARGRTGRRRVGYIRRSFCRRPVLAVLKGWKPPTCQATKAPARHRALPPPLGASAVTRGLRRRPLPLPTMSYCRPCSRLFASKRSLRQHNASSHSFRCSHCEKVFGSQQACSQHANDVHKLRCGTCNRCFTRVESLAQDAQATHHHCGPCERTFVHAVALAQHTQALHAHRCGRCEDVVHTGALAHHTAATHTACDRNGDDAAEGPAQNQQIAVVQSTRDGVDDVVEAGGGGRLQQSAPVVTETSGEGPNYRGLVDGLRAVNVAPVWQGRGVAGGGGYATSQPVASVVAVEQVLTLNRMVFSCSTCRKEFRLLSSLMQHVEGCDECSLPVTSERGGRDAVLRLTVD
jgi:hypothetical protein